MQTILNATYKNGVLILDKKLGFDKEGKKFKVLIVEKEMKKVQKGRFFELLEKHSFELRPNHKFQREDLHER